MAPMEPPFKRCLDCSAKMAISDGHSRCLYCLGEAHQPWICRHCRKFTKLELKERKCDLRIYLMEKALQPADLPSSQPPPRPLILGCKTIWKKVRMEKALAESLKQLEEDRSSTESENLAVQSDRPSTLMPTPQPAKRKRPASGSPSQQPACSSQVEKREPRAKKGKKSPKGRDEHGNGVSPPRQSDKQSEEDVMET